MSMSNASNKVLNLTSTAALVLRFSATLPQNNHLRSSKLARRYEFKEYRVMNKFLAFIAATFLVACQTTPVQENGKHNIKPEGESLSLEAICMTHPCRKDVRVSFRTDGDPVDQTIPLYWPRVFNGVISVLPGESFLIEADIVDGQLTNILEVSENKNPHKTITIKMSQMDGGVGMMLSLSNPFKNVALKFNMEMIDFAGKPHQTSSCPVMPNASIFESWPHPIPELVIKNPTVIPVSEMESMACVY